MKKHTISDAFILEEVDALKKALESGDPVVLEVFVRAFFYVIQDVIGDGK